MINRGFDNDINFPNKFLKFWKEYRSLVAGRPEEMLKSMIYYHNVLFPDFEMSSCTNCGGRWKRAEDRMDIAWSILVEEYKENDLDEVNLENDTEISEVEESPLETTYEVEEEDSESDCGCPESEEVIEIKRGKKSNH